MFLSVLNRKFLCSTKSFINMIFLTWFNSLIHSHLTQSIWEWKSLARNIINVRCLTSSNFELQNKKCFRSAQSRKCLETVPSKQRDVFFTNFILRQDFTDILLSYFKFSLFTVFRMCFQLILQKTLWCTELQ